MKYQKKDLEKFPLQIEFALKNYKKHELNPHDIDQIVLAGLGGSGIAGRIVKSYFQKVSTLPIEVISDYNLPFYVGKRTLVILNSYSGNTEETLSSYMDALEKQARIIVITTGGILLELAEESKIQSYMAEPGFQPRMALGYSLTYLFLIMGELFGIDFKRELEKTIKLFENTDYYIDKANINFCGLNSEVTKKWIIVTDPETYAVGVRFAQQLNENAKAEAFVHELPEANHNVIESYYGKLDSVFIFLYAVHSPRLNHRFNFLEKLLTGNQQSVIRLNVKELNIIHIYEMIYTLDWMSLLIADKRKIKSDEIHNIIRLKDFMKEK